MLKQVEHESAPGMKNKFWLRGLLEYKQFWNGYFSKLFFEVVAFTQLTKMKLKKQAENLIF